MIIDHVKNWEMSRSATERRSNEILTLNYLAEGLHFLNDQVWRIEEGVNERLPDDWRGLLFLNAPKLEGVSQGPRRVRLPLVRGLSM